MKEQRFCRRASIAMAVFAVMSFPSPTFCFFVGSRTRSTFSGIRWDCRPRSFQVKSKPVRTTTMTMNINSDDPFEVLGLTEPTSDLKVIKRAYKRMALKFHPDMSTTKDSPPEEKKQASDVFAKINWAYQTLSGKRRDDSTYKSSTSSSSTAGSTGWTPPHRRNGPAYSSSSSSSSSTSGNGGTSWEDFMPKSPDQDQYDAGGDSFGKIFSDLFEGASAGAAGLGGRTSIFKDFVDFLEGNIDGYGGTSADDASELRELLNTASVEEIGNEMDDTELVVKQLKYKLNSINDEILTVTAEVKLTARYLEKMGLEESLAELNARKVVVDGYLKKGQKRFSVLQKRYKELITRGENDSYAGGGGSSRSSWEDVKREATSSSSYSAGSSSSSSSSSSSYSTASDSSSNPSSGGSRAAKDDEEDAWKNEGFGSPGRGRGSRGSRGRSRQRTTTDASSSRSSAKTADPPRRESVRSPDSNTNSSRQTASTGTGYQTSSTSVNTSPSTNVNVPPHRRTSSFRYEEDDKRRLRELKVDDEFDKLKKDLGL